MFGESTLSPQHSNILPLIWTYLVKTDGTNKSRYVCNGNSRCEITATLDHTYEAALDQSGACTFWTIMALHNYISYGTDATNTFAEAPPPKTPFYVTVNKQSE